MISKKCIKATYVIFQFNNNNLKTLILNMKSILLSNTKNMLFLKTKNVFSQIQKVCCF